MTIHLSGDCEELIRSLLDGGRFATEAEIIDEALRLLQEREDQSRLAELRREIAVGIEQADRGETAPFDPRAALLRIRLETALLNDVTLGEDWNRPEEDAAWSHL